MGASVEAVYVELGRIANDVTVPALAAAGIPGVDVYLLGHPSMSFPALWHQGVDEVATAPRDNTRDRDKLRVDINVAIPALNDDAAMTAVQALDVLRAIYSAEAVANVGPLRGSSRINFGLSYRQFGSAGPVQHVARVRLEVPVTAAAARFS